MPYQSLEDEVRRVVGEAEKIVRKNYSHVDDIDYVLVTIYRVKQNVYIPPENCQVGTAITAVLQHDVKEGYRACPEIKVGNFILEEGDPQDIDEVTLFKKYPIPRR